jgi:hypothetical protein
MRRFRLLPLSTIPLTLALGACGQSPREPVVSTVQAVRAGAGADGGNVMLSADVLVTDGPVGVPCGDGQVTVTMEVSRNGEEGPWVLIEQESITTTCVDSGRGDLALVMDNSGSQVGNLEGLRADAKRVVDQVLGEQGRASFVRVSTEAGVKSELTDDPRALSAAIDGMFVANGWTALWDGVRMGNETLGAGRLAKDQLETYSDKEGFCAASQKQGIVVFTDARDNNSAGAKLTSEKYPGDGIDTSLEDILSLKVGGTQTPIYVVGLGDQVDPLALGALAEKSGGRFFGVDSPDQAGDVLGSISEYFGSAHRVCTEIPSHLCGGLDVRVTQHFNAHGKSGVETTTHHVEVPCDARARGRVATILLTMTATETPEESMMKLVANTVNWASPVDAPKVLFVLDDSNHGEFGDDTKQIHEKLVASGYDASYLDEPAAGIAANDLAGYDVVWFSNPGYPMDDQQSFDALLRFSQEGGGVVLQGDDMSWSWGKNFATKPLTRLQHVDNGTDACGVHIDNQKGGRYRVSMNADTHPIITGLEGESVLYGDDIDLTTPMGDDIEVVAWATVEGAKGKCEKRPAVTAFTPEVE